MKATVPDVFPSVSLPPFPAIVPISFPSTVPRHCSHQFSDGWRECERKTRDEREDTPKRVFRSFVPVFVRFPHILSYRKKNIAYDVCFCLVSLYFSMCYD